MSVSNMRCEDEQIQFCGKNQTIGFLLIANTEMRIIGASENCAAWLNTPYSDILGNELIHVVQQFFPHVEKDVQSAFNGLSEESLKNRAVQEVMLNDRPFYLTTYGYDNRVYLEFEQKHPTHIPSFISLYAYSQQIEKATDIWEALCSCIAEVIGFDRVMTYRFHADKSGQVIAEKVREDLDSYLGLHYPEFDIPQQARALYVKHLTRLTSDISSPTYPIHTLNNEQIDLSFSTIRALSPIHLQYLENAGAQASISFSIIVHGELWGLVTCQHETAKFVDLSQRHLAVFLTQYAVNRYLSLQKEIDLNFNKQVKEFELALKEKLIIKNEILPVLSSFAKQLSDFVQADGLAIRHKEATLVFGDAPDSATVGKIHAFINKNHRKMIYSKESFVIDHGEELALGDVNFAGLVKIDIDSSKEFSLIWFRREQVTERVWAGKPTKVMTYDQALQAFVPSPRNSFDAWKQLVKGVSPAWTEIEIYFMKRIRQLIRESLLRKSEEIYSLNQELILLNNALDTYSYTVSHDLKNPLSVIKLSVQMLQMKRDITPELLAKLTVNIKDASELMESMLNKIYEFSKVKEFRYQPNVIHTDQIIPQIVDHCKTRYGTQQCEVTLGDLLPIMGEKTLIYQLFLNIVSNAIKYSSKRDDAQISIHSVQQGQKVRYSVRDNGIGIADAELNNIYDIFKRMSNSDGFEGSGVGLAIVKRIVDRLGVEIIVESEIGKGTCFHLDFPN
ncbi:ATP-binding protein [Sphingobacterium paludis]|uniref:histidine kinase n=1 Tax=Sphingobacterium paludis TaxID=1476465 RepID=A0A4R7D2T4_9SPHI|nr:ATP-binding protein [Sphingobacterium paludis]TDS13126.1 light-regulated signal transduction histidine kinase (bacteriophytochrome) [Sphingobacterium paludis]